jgi:hypothetical protein
VASFFAWSIVLISLIDTKPSPTAAHLVTWLVALPLELIIIGASLAIYTVPHHEPQVGDPIGGKRRREITAWEVLEIVVYFCRLALLLGLSVIYLVFKIASRYANRTAPGTPASDEQAPLLGNADHSNGNGNVNGQAYGSSPGHKSGEAKEQPDAWAKPTETPSVNWYQYLKGYMVLLPYLWPAKSLRLQLLALTCFAIMIAQRAINVFVPILTAKITDLSKLPGL